MEGYCRDRIIPICLSLSTLEVAIHVDVRGTHMRHRTQKTTEHRKHGTQKPNKETRKRIFGESTSESILPEETGTELLAFPPQFHRLLLQFREQVENHFVNACQSMLSTFRLTLLYAVLVCTIQHRKHGTQKTNEENGKTIFREGIEICFA